MPTARTIAIELLLRQEESTLPIDQLLEEHLVGVHLQDPRDRQLVTALIYGSLQWRGYLDWVIEKYSRHPLRKMKNLTRQALRVGLYQLFFMDRIPPAAAVSETVQVLKDKGQPAWLIGFVNGLLRNVARTREELPAPGRREETLPLTARLSHPPWLLNRWEKRYGPEKTIAICRANNSPAPLSLRVNTVKTTVAHVLAALREAGVAAERGRYAPAAVLLPEFHGSVASLPGYQEGMFQVQDEAAQLVALLTAPFQQGAYLDACAGLGGKTTQWAELLPAGSSLTAVEPSIKRVARLEENLGRLGLTERVTVFPGQLADLAATGDGFDAILLDAPCSGLGVIRRHPDIRWNRSPEDLLRYQQKQLTLCRQAAKVLRPGGVLVYATCSSEPEENEQVMDRFLRERTDFTITDPREFLPLPAAELVDGRGFLRTLPTMEGGLDGFFAARLARKAV